MKFTAIAMLIGATQAFPSFDSFHAHCEMTVSVADSCANTKAAIHKMVGTTSPNLDPAQGFYHPKSESDSMIWATRTGPGKKYTDDVMWEFSSNGDSCSVHSKSKSQSLSYYDYGFNFCNMYNAYRTSYWTPAVSNVSTKNCKFSVEASDIEKTCAEKK